jgi:hypothetical protein
VISGEKKGQMSFNPPGFYYLNFLAQIEIFSGQYILAEQAICPEPKRTCLLYTSRSNICAVAHKKTHNVLKHVAEAYTNRYVDTLDNDGGYP